MEKLYYTLTEATAHLGVDAVNLGERGLLPMAFRWPKTSNTMKTGFAFEYMAPGYERVRFNYITSKEFSDVVDTARRDDKIIVRHTFVSLEDLARADEIIERRDKSPSAALAESLFNHGVPRRNTYMGLDDIYVTAEAMAAYEENTATPGAKVEAVRGITKGAVINAFEGLHFDRDKWSKYLADPPDWLAECRVTPGRKGDNSTPATWNPVLIAAALSEEKRKVQIKKLDAVFVRLKDWADEWQEASTTFPD